MAARLFATDLDGTLLVRGSDVSPRVRAALAAVQEAGLVVVLVTARNWRSVRDIAADAGVRGLAVCSNGAITYDLERDEVVRSHPFDRQILDAFLRRTALELDLALGWETALGAFRTPRFHELSGPPPPNFAAKYLSAVEILDGIADDHAVTKVVVRHESLTPAEVLRVLQPLADQVVVTYSGGTFVEIMAPGITKGFGLATLCEERGISAGDVVAIGDQINDLPMLRWAGRGIAMGNADPAVRAEITEHTASNLEDGVAVVIDSILEQLTIHPPRTRQ
ncbi:MAG TPA: Cof-type HAD-IIB family hydrolase [Acidimicrobiales bacterium]|nr:Cof-type HAD-IIB family hydrolase [Acidimicrobiales bacterium]